MEREAQTVGREALMGRCIRNVKILMPFKQSGLTELNDFYLSLRAIFNIIVTLIFKSVMEKSGLC